MTKENIPAVADGLEVIPEEEFPDGIITIDAYVPAYGQECFNCGQSPVVKGVKDGKIAYDGDMCGPCTWGEASTLNPSTWNE